jgi:hypothetical protein
MLNPTQSHALPGNEPGTKNPKPEELEDSIVPPEDLEKTAAYRILEVEISPEQKKEEARIMSVSTHARINTKSTLM